MEQTFRAIHFFERTGTRNLNLNDNVNLKSNKQFCILYQNTRGINSVINSVKIQTRDTHYDAIAFTETWLKPFTNDNLIFESNFAIYRCDRELQQGGGVCLAIKDPQRFRIKPIDFSVLRRNAPNVDIVGVDLNGRHQHVVTIIVIYVPPHVRADQFHAFLSDLSQIALNKPRMCIVGDFNVPSFVSSDLSNGKCRDVLQFMSYLGLVQTNNILNSRDVLLDLVFVRDFTCTVERDDAPIITEDIYHPTLSINMNLYIAKVKNFPNFENARGYNYRKANILALYSEISNINWYSVLQGGEVDVMCRSFYKQLYTAIENNVPKRKYSSMKYPVWYDKELILNLKLKFKHYKNYKRYNRLTDLENFKRYRKLTKTQISNKFKQYMSDIERNLRNDPQSLWKFIRTKTNKTRIPADMIYNNKCINTPTEIVQSFAEYFMSVYTKPRTGTFYQEETSDLPSVHLNAFTKDMVIGAVKNLKRSSSIGDDEIPFFIVADCINTLADPLLAIFNKSIESHTFPKLWKTSRIVPVHKSGSNADIANYRPISILSVFSKIFERLIHDSILHQVKHFISDSQHGFVTKRSTTTNLVQMTELISDSLEQKGQIDVVYTDFRKAFDTIDINITLKKLCALGFHYNLIMFFQSYLTERNQYVFYNGVKSEAYLTTSGVPQGSTLGPLVFLLFINDLPGGMDSNTLLFADDLKIYRQISSIVDCHKLQQDIGRLTFWCRENNLELNVQKCKVVSYTEKRNATLFEYKINNVSLERIDCISDLGVMFDSKLSFRYHIAEIISKASRRVGFVLRNCRELSSVAVLRTIFIQLIRPTLEYASTVWSPSTKIQIDQLEAVQRRYLKNMHLKETGSYPRIGHPNVHLLNEFNLHSLEARRKYFDAAFAWNTVNNNIDCPGILAKINFRVPRVGNRNNDTFYLNTAMKSVKYNAPIPRMCRTINNFNQSVDIFNCKKAQLRQTCLSSN